MSTLSSIRPFIGAKDYKESKSFYRDWGFEEINISPKLTYYRMQNFGFYLQDAYVKDWVDNTMLFLEVEDLDNYWSELESKKLPEKYDGVRLVPIRKLDWGSEGFLYDPSGILWHIGTFNK